MYDSKETAAAYTKLRADRVQRLRKVVEAASSPTYSGMTTVFRTVLPTIAGAEVGSTFRGKPTTVTTGHEYEQKAVTSKYIGANAEHSATALNIAAPLDVSAPLSAEQIVSASPDYNLFNVAALMQAIKDRESAGSGGYLAVNHNAAPHEDALGAYQFLPSTAWEQLSGVIDLSAFCTGTYATRGYQNPTFQEWFLKNQGAQDLAALRFIHAGVKCGATTPDRVGAWWLGGSAGLKRPNSIADSNGTTPAVHGANILASYRGRVLEARYAKLGDGRDGIVEGPIDHGPAADSAIGVHGTGNSTINDHPGVLSDVLSRLHEHLG